MASHDGIPPDIPDQGKWTGPGPAKLDGDADFRGADMKNSVVTGHIYGYEVIVANINVTVDAANKLTTNIQEFVTKVDLQLHLVLYKVGSTADLLGHINDLVVQQAKKRGLTVDKKVKEPTEIPLEETSRGNGIGSTPVEKRQKEHAAREILAIACFKAIVERVKGTHEVFDDINDKINKALKAIGLLQKLHGDELDGVPGVSVRGAGPGAQCAQKHPQSPKAKVQLSENDKRDVLLAKGDVEYLEKLVDIHWEALYNRFILFEYSLNHERQAKNEDDMESMKTELEKVKQLVRNSWKEMKQLAKYLCGNDQPTSPLRVDKLHRPRPQPPPQALRRYLPEPTRVNSLYFGWEFRKSPPPHPYGLPDQPAQKPSWRFSVPQRIPFSTEELFLRVLAQAAQRAKSDRTLRDDYCCVLKKAGQRALVDELVQAQNDLLQRDYPMLEWTIAGLEARTDAWALMAAQGRYRARGKKKRYTTTAFEVILKTQWHMPIPGGTSGPTPFGPSGLGPGPGPLPGGKSCGPPDGHHPQAPQGRPGGFLFPSGGGAEGGQGVPIINTANAGVFGGPQGMPQIPVHSQTRLRGSNRPITVLREPKWFLVKEAGKKTDKIKDPKKRSRHRNAEAHKSRQQVRNTTVYAELRGPGRHYRTRAAGLSGGDYRPSSWPGLGIPPRHYSVPPMQPFNPYMPARASGFVSEYGGPGHAPGHIPPGPPLAHPLPPRPIHMHMPAAQPPRQDKKEEEREDEEAEMVVQEMLEEFSGLSDTKVTMNNRRCPNEWNMQVPGQQLRPEAAMIPPVLHSHPLRGRHTERREHSERQRRHAERHVSISMSLMRRVERESSRRLAAEGERLRARSARMELMAERRAQHPPVPEAPAPAERIRLVREREPRREWEARELRHRQTFSSHRDT